MVMVGASTSVGWSMRLTTSRPNTVFPDPGAAMMWSRLSSRYESRCPKSRAWYVRHVFWKTIDFGNAALPTSVEAGLIKRGLYLCERECGKLIKIDFRRVIYRLQW